MRTTTAIATVLIWAGMAPAGVAQMIDLDRQRLVAHLEMTSRWLLDEVSGLSTAQLQFRRAPNTWNIMEVIEHLVVVGPIYWQDLQKAMKAPPSDRAKLNTDADLLWYGIDRTGREKAVPAEEAKGQLRDLNAGLDAYRQQHAQLLAYVKTTKDDLRSHYVERQGSDAYQWALLISTHEQRHILQIREIKADANYPKK